MRERCVRQRSPKRGKAIAMGVTSAVAQDIAVGPVNVDIGNDYLDLAFVLVILAALLIGYALKKRIDRRP